MNTSNTSQNPTAEALAREFAQILASWAKPDERRQIVELNRAERNSSICHSHDFYDANQAMIDALEKFGVELDIQSTEQNALTDEAWDIAKRNGFWFPEAGKAVQP